MKPISPNIKECLLQNGSLAVIQHLLVHVAVFRSLSAFLPTNLLIVICVYLTGLITGSWVSAVAISQTLGIVSHDAITRMLNSMWWTTRQLLLVVVRLVTLLGTEGWLIVDDVVVPKPYSRLITFCGWDFDHAEKRNVFGLRLVFIVWSNGWLTLPLGFYVWQKDITRKPHNKKKSKKQGRPRKRGRKISSQTPQACKQRERYHARKKEAKQIRSRTATGAHYHTKNELARVLIWQVVRAGVNAHFILFDNWYASKQNLRLMNYLQLSWVTRLKSNTMVNFQGLKVSIKKVATSVKKENYHYYAKIGARVRSFDVKAFGMLAKLTAIKDDTHCEEGCTKYLATNALSLTNVEHIIWYRRRWCIEVFFRDSKSLLGLGYAQVRKPQAVLTHTVLVCWAYTILQLLKPITHLPQISISRSKKSLLSLLLLVNPDGSSQMVRHKANGKLEEADLQDIIKPVRTRLPNSQLRETLEIT